MGMTEEQRAAIEAVDGNVAVAAGAGSGKTFVLAERFLHILRRESGRRPQERLTEAADIMAITFTRKAAGEMKRRVRRLIEQELENDADGFWQAQLQSLERAQISTIHGLCSRILRENPVEAQLDPAFIVAEEFAGSELARKCLRQYLRRELQKGSEEVRLLAETYGVSSLLSQLEAQLPALPELAAADLRRPYEESAAALPQKQRLLCAELRELAERREELTGGKKTKTAAALEKLAAALDKILPAAVQEEPDFSLLDELFGGLRAQGRLKEDLEKVRNLRSDVTLACADKAALRLLPAWQKTLAELAAYIRSEKLGRDMLTYDDLELMAVELLERSGQVREKYLQRFRYIMVDEFQDTNERQRQLIYLLCGGDSSRLLGGKLFIVGDPKQSIYRFRGADVSIFARVRREIAASGGKCLTLSKNFRSTDKVLAAVNDTFELLLGTDGQQDVYFEALDFAREGAEKPLLLLAPYDKQAEKSRYQAEGEAAAAAVRALHEGRALTEGGQAGTPVPYNDITILLRSMTHVTELTEALQQYGIPYQVVEGRGFYERQEVQDLLNLLMALHNRRRSLELAGALRSPYFGLNDETVTGLFLSGADCLWDALQQADSNEYGAEQGVLLQRAAALLAHLRNYASLSALPELWQELWQALAVDAVLPLQEHGAGKLANAQKLRRLAQEYCADCSGGLGEWLDYVRRLQEANIRETAVDAAGADAVSIMTIHKAKGLEFPVVLLPFLDGGNNSDRGEAQYLSGQGLGIKAADMEGNLGSTGVLQRIREQDRRLDQEERKRLLYVAMTRAADRLVMTGIADAKEVRESDDLAQLSWLKQLRQIFHDSRTVDLGILKPGEAAAEPKPAPLPQTRAAAPELLAAIAPLPESRGGSRRFTPAALQRYLYCQRQYFYQMRMALPPLEETGGGAEELPARITGSIVHKALEKFKGDAEAALQAAIRQYAPGSAAPLARRLFFGYLESSLYAGLPQKQLRELSFLLPLDNGLLISGIIDCIGLAADGSLVLVDYKTGRRPQEGERLTGYYYQLALYRAAAERLLGRPVGRARLHFLQGLQAVPLPADRDYLADACLLCEEISRKDAEQDFLCTGKREGLAACAHCPYNYLCKQD